jgi:hypothetical protein
MPRRHKRRGIQPHVVPISCRRCFREFRTLRGYMRHTCKFPKSSGATVELPDNDRRNDSVTKY